MNCPKCNFENPENATYCINCGARIDGKILCPKCKNPIDPDVDACPHCGRKIPHANKVDETKPSGISKVVRILAFVFAILTIVMVSFLMLNTIFGRPVASYSLSSSKETSYYLMVGVWFDKIGEITGSSNWYDYWHRLIEVLLPAVLVLINLAVTITFGIFTILKCVKALKRDSNINPFAFVKDFAIVLISNKLCSEVIISVTPYFSYIPFIKDILMFLSLILILGEFVAYGLTGLKRRRPSILIEKFLFGAVFLFGYAILGNLSEHYINFNGSAYTGLQYFLTTISNMKNVTDTNILLVTLSSVDLLHYIILVSLTCSLMVFVVVGFFSDNDRKMRYKIPSNVVSLVMLILSTISLGIYIATAVIIAKEYGATNYVFNDPLTISNYSLFNIIFGCSTAALFISKGIRNYEKLVAETTAK